MTEHGGAMPITIVTVSVLLIHVVGRAGTGETQQMAPSARRARVR